MTLGVRHRSNVTEELPPWRVTRAITSSIVTWSRGFPASLMTPSARSPSAPPSRRAAPGVVADLWLGRQLPRRLDRRQLQPIYYFLCLPLAATLALAVLPPRCLA